MSAKNHTRGGSPSKSQPHTPKRPTPRKRSTVLNWRVLVWTLVGLVAGGGGAWLWHAWQVKDFAGGAIEQGQQLETKAQDLAQQARQLLDQARNLESEARRLQAQGNLDEAQGRRDQTQELFRQAQSRTQEAFQNRQAAMQYFLRYTELTPGDPEGPVALARLSHENGNVPAAIEWYAAALRAAADQPQPWPEAAKVRALRAELLLAWGQAFQREESRTQRTEYRDSAVARFRQAQEEAVAVLAQPNADPENQSKAQRALALSLLGLHDLKALDTLPDQVGSVGDVLEQAFQQNTSDSELALALARVYRQFPELLSESRLASFGSAGEQDQKLQAAADTVMRQLVDNAENALSEAAGAEQAQAQAANAYLSRYRYLAGYALPGAHADLQRALELAPNSAGVHILAGWHLMEEAAALQASGPGSIVARNDKLDEAAQHFLTAKDSEFGNLTVYLGLAEVYRRLGKTSDALDTYRLALQNVGEADWDLNTALIDALINAQKLTPEEAGKRFKALDDHLAAQRANFSPSILRSREARRDLLRARWLVQSGEFQPAAGILDRLLTDRSLAASDPGQTLNRDVVQARLLLAQCYEAQARSQLAAAAQGDQAADAIKTTPDAPQSPQLSAAAETARDQSKNLFRQTAQVYEELARDLPQVAQFREAAGRMYLAAGQPDRTVFNLQRAIQLDDSIALRFLMARARLEHAISDRSSAALLQAARHELDELEKRVQQEPIAQPWAVGLMQAELLALKPPGDPAETAPQPGLATLRALEEKYPFSSELCDVLAARYEQLGAADDLARVSACREIIAALSQGRAPDAVVPEDRLKQLIGDDSPVWRFYHANRLLIDAAAPPQTRKQQIRQAAQLADTLLNDRPDWPQAHLLAASVKRAEGNLVDAVEGLEKAAQLEPTNLRTLEQLVRIQLQIGQSEQAEARIAAARAKFPKNDALLQLETLVKRSTGDRQTALELARQEVAARPGDPAPRMRLGALLQETGDTAQAENMFREALLLKPDDPGPMTALFALYGQTGKTGQAEAMLKDLAASEQLKPWQKQLVLARGYEALEQPEPAQEHFRLAEEAYRKALQDTPGDEALRLALVDLLLRGDDPGRFDRADEQVQKVLAGQPASPAARRARARILWLRNAGDDRQQASAIYDALAADPAQGSAADRYRHAQMLESLGQFAAATEAFDEVVESTALTPENLAAQIGRSIRVGQLGKAEAELARLEKMAPGDFRTLALKVQLLHRTGRDAEIEPLVANLQQRLEKLAAADPAQKAPGLQMIGDLYSSVDMHDKAEPFYKSLVQANPAAVGRLAASIASQGRAKEAVDTILAAAGDQVTDLVKATALCAVFVSSNPGQAEWQAAEPVLEAAAQAHSDHADLLSNIANVHIVRGQAEKAVELLEKAAALEPENVVVLNNLATMLGEQPGRAPDALEHIDRAIKLSNYAPGLLDTKGTILIHLDRAAEAVAVLDQAVAGNVQDPRYLLHLAVACDKLGDAVKAKEMLQNALAAGLLDRPEFILTAQDKTWLDQLKKKLEP
jgi:predicted Zn-dependent protease